MSRNLLAFSIWRWPNSRGRNVSEKYLTNRIIAQQADVKHYVCNTVAWEVFNIKLDKQKVGQYELHTHTQLVTVTHHDILQGSKQNFPLWIRSTLPVARLAWGPDWPQETSLLVTQLHIATCHPVTHRCHQDAHRFLSPSCKSLSHRCRSLPVTQLHIAVTQMHIASCNPAAHRYLSPSCTSLPVTPAAHRYLSSICTSPPTIEHSIQFRILGITAIWVPHSRLLFVTDSSILFKHVLYIPTMVFFETCALNDMGIANCHF